MEDSRSNEISDSDSIETFLQIFSENEPAETFLQKLLDDPDLIPNVSIQIKVTEITPQMVSEASNAILKVTEVLEHVFQISSRKMLDKSEEINFDDMFADICLITETDWMETVIYISLNVDEDPSFVWPDAMLGRAKNIKKAFTLFENRFEIMLVDMDTTSERKRSMIKFYSEKIVNMRDVVFKYLFASIIAIQPPEATGSTYDISTGLDIPDDDYVIENLSKFLELPPESSKFKLVANSSLPKEITLGFVSFIMSLNYSLPNVFLGYSEVFEGYRKYLEDESETGDLDFVNLVASIFQTLPNLSNLDSLFTNLNYLYYLKSLKTEGIWDEKKLIFDFKDDFEIRYTLSRLLVLLEVDDVDVQCTLNTIFTLLRPASLEVSLMVTPEILITSLSEFRKTFDFGSTNADESTITVMQNIFNSIQENFNFEEMEGINVLKTMLSAMHGKWSEDDYISIDTIKKQILDLDFAFKKDLKYSTRIETVLTLLDEFLSFVYNSHSIEYDKDQSIVYNLIETNLE